MSDISPLVDSIVQVDERLSVAEKRINGGRVPSRSAWKTPTLTNGWTNYSTQYESAAYALDNDGFVHLRGLIKSGSTGASCMTLPVELRPPTERYIITASWNGMAALRVSPDGTVRPENITGYVDTWTSLQGCYRRTEFTPDETIMGAAYTVNIGDYHPTWAGPRTHLHPGGMVLALGLGRIYGTPATYQEIVQLPLEHGVSVQLIHTAMSLGPTLGLTRYDTQRNKFMNVAGAVGNQWMAVEGLSWPSARTYDSNVECTLGAGNGNYTTAGMPFIDTVRATKDDMGWCWVGGLVVPASAAGGAVIATLPVGYRPTKYLIFPGVSDNAYCPIEIQPDGDIVFNQPGSVAWVAFSHTFWTDN